jgi:hypothetical protein
MFYIRQLFCNPNIIGLLETCPNLSKAFLILPGTLDNVPVCAEPKDEFFKLVGVGLQGSLCQSLMNEKLAVRKICNRLHLVLLVTMFCLCTMGLSGSADCSSRLHFIRLFLHFSAFFLSTRLVVKIFFNLPTLHSLSASLFPGTNSVTSSQSQNSM